MLLEVVTEAPETGHGGETESPPTLSVEQPGLPALTVVLPAPEPLFPVLGFVPRELAAGVPGRADGTPPWLPASEGALRGAAAGFPEAPVAHPATSSKRRPRPGRSL